MNSKKNIIDFFNPENLEHCMGYSYFQKSGTWPKKFLPKNIYFPPAWEILLMSKITDSFIENQIARLRKC